MPCLESNDMDFEATDLISVIRSFGSVKIKSRSCTVAYQPPKHMQAQTQAVRQIPSKFELEKKVRMAGGRITCIAVTNDNTLLLCNDCIDKDNVSMWTETGQHLKSCTVDGRPFGIAIGTGKEEAVVTLTFLKSIQFINITSLTPGRKINIEVPGPHGVAVLKDSIYVGSNNGKVSIINRISEKCLKTLDIGRSHITSIIPFVNDKDVRLYCSEFGSGNQVTCIRLDGTCIFSCAVNGPWTLALDTKGNLYVTGYDSNDLHRISPDGRVDDIILKNYDGLNHPLAVAFNNTYNRLYISNPNNVMIFNCK